MRLRSGRPAMDMSWTQAAQRLGGRVLVGRAAGPARRGGYGHSGRGRDLEVQVGVVHVGGGRRRLEVETSNGTWPAEHDDGMLLRTWMNSAFEHEVVFPFELRADRWVQDVDVDGTLVAFTVVGGDGSWAASGRTADRLVQITARGGWPAEGLSLMSVDAASVSAEPIPG